MSSEQPGHSLDPHEVGVAKPVALQRTRLARCDSPRIIKDGRVLMLAWMNEASLRESFDTGYACYWSRSRGRLWRKGEESGHRQKLHRVQLDCDGDALLLQVEQIGVACHTGRLSCFFYQWDKHGWQIAEDVLVDPEKVYR